jgi:SH3 domain-containing YSC84-like protein 1
MFKPLTRLASIAALTTLAFALPAQATEKGELLRNANEVVNDLRHDPAFGTARNMLQGVLLHRTGRGWSTPRFYDMGSASFGLQIGLEQAKLVFIINSKRALRGIEKGELKLGAGAGITVVTLSSAAEGATTTHGGDMVVWASGTGAYGGLTFNGTIIKQDKELNAVPATGPEAQALRRNLASIW